MLDTVNNTHLIECEKNVYALEDNSFRALEKMIRQTEDARICSIFEIIKGEAEHHKALLHDHLSRSGESPSPFKLSGKSGGVVRYVVDSLAGDIPVKNARASYAIESIKIASYEILARFANEAGDEELEKIVLDNISDERRMISTLADNWDLFVDCALEEVDDDDKYNYA
jgi:ferritin-like metal-binding protein YciE